MKHTISCICVECLMEIAMEQTDGDVQQSQNLVMAHLAGQFELIRDKDYDPNAEAEVAYEREMDSRLARERDRAWEDLNLDGREL